MARLNDPPVPAPVESVDALKRRFIRQNREIARVNSTQSLRIRNLEAEISRLLAENIAIREQAINIAQEAERLRAAQKVASEIVVLKDRLEAKLQEVNAIVTELGALPENATRRASGRRKSIASSKARSPDQKEWRNRQTIGGILSAEGEVQEGRLPAILEDKSYPRRTMDTADLQSLTDPVGDSLESPEIGPPPVAHFDDPEPIDFNPAMGEGHILSNVAADSNSLVPLSVNLETRRKRRTSAFLQDMPAPNDDKSKEKDDSSMIVPHPKAGAKRKLEASELEEKPDRPITTDDFVFRKTENSVSGAARRGSRFARPPGRPATDNNLTSGTTSPAKNAPAIRKVLAPKSANSPTKRKANVNSKASTLKDDMAAQTNPRHDQVPLEQLSQHPLQKARAPLEYDDQPLELPPKTPMGLDLFSPPSTEPSTRNTAQVQEMAITNSVEDVLNGSIGRGSRRAKAAVSYAEPNLRDKMRRPGKELVGAVEGIDQRHRSEDRERDKSEDPIPRIVVIKKESGISGKDAASWIELPPAKEEAPSPLRDKEKRTPEEKELKRSRSMMSTDELGKAVSGLSIFDPPVSSPAKSPDSQEEDARSHVELAKRQAQRKTSIKARRHSVAGQSQGHTLSRSASEAALTAGTFSRQSSSSGSGSRPSSAASLRNERASTLLDQKRVMQREKEREKGKEIEIGLEGGGGVAVAVGSSRMERAASRRRSMMV